MYEYLWRLTLAGIIGFIVGIINSRQDDTGPRVFSIICMGATLITLIAAGIYQIIPWLGDPGRLPAQVISALGFLGSGMIWITRDNRVTGITGATALWLTAILGMLIGAGLKNASVLGVFFFILIFWFSNIARRCGGTRSGGKKKPGEKSPRKVRAT
ncbi:MAG: MgtC/SapB family protein [Syntrophomonas sp.]|nr:MgtC/SapB family protein [Syntrophomonas sp.]